MNSTYILIIILVIIIILAYTSTSSSSENLSMSIKSSNNPSIIIKNNDTDYYTDIRHMLIGCVLEKQPLTSGNYPDDLTVGSTPTNLTVGFYSSIGSASNIRDSNYLVSTNNSYGQNNAWLGCYNNNDRTRYSEPPPEVYNRYIIVYPNFSVVFFTNIIFQGENVTIINYGAKPLRIDLSNMNVITDNDLYLSNLSTDMFIIKYSNPNRKNYMDSIYSIIVGFA